MKSGSVRSSRGSAGRAAAVFALLAIAGLVSLGSAHADHQTVELVSTGPAGGNGPFDVASDDLVMSPDGSRAFFTTAEPLVAADTDSQLDLYERSGGTTSLLSIGPAGGNGPFDLIFGRNRVSHDGSSIVFTTQERLTNDDTDDRRDVYQRSDGVTRLVSTGPAGGNGDFDITSLHMSLNGETIVFVTEEVLTSDDTNAAEDAYLRAGGETELIAKAPVSERIDRVRVLEISPDGRRVFLDTSRQVSPDDTDVFDDVYSWEDGVATLESIGANGEETQSMFGERVAADGEHVAFLTASQLVPEDTDSSTDVYVRSRETITLASIGPTGGNGAVPATLRGISSRGGRVFFETAEALVAADTDVERDLYTHGNGVTELMTTGPLAGGADRFDIQYGDSSADGRRAFFLTRERLVPEDDDGVYSAYEYSDGRARWLAPAWRVLRASEDGSRVFIMTTLPLVPADTDPECWQEGPPGCTDVYEIRDGQISLVSTSPTDAHGSASVCEPTFGGTSVAILVCPFSSSEDGTQVLFRHYAPLVPGDTDSNYDAYLASAQPEPVRSDYKNGPAFCRALREFLGEQRFGERYGGGANAFGKCVSGGGTKKASK